MIMEVTNQMFDEFCSVTNSEGRQNDRSVVEQSIWLIMSVFCHQLQFQQLQHHNPAHKTMRTNPCAPTCRWKNISANTRGGSIKV